MKTIKMIVAAWTVLALMAFAGAAVAQVGQRLVPLGYCQLTSIDTAVLVSSCSGGIPDGTNVVLMRAETQAVRYRDDGTNPTTTVGMPMLIADAPVLYVGTPSAIRVIAAVGGGKLDVLFYRSP